MLAYRPLFPGSSQDIQELVCVLKPVCFDCTSVSLGGRILFHLEWFEIYDANLVRVLWSCSTKKTL